MSRKRNDVITAEDVRWGWREVGGHEHYRAHAVTQATLEKGARMLTFGYRVSGHEYPGPKDVERHVEGTRRGAEVIGVSST